MDKAEIKDKIKGALVKGMTTPLKVMPLWVEAIGVGAFISSIVDAHPGFKARLKDLEGKVFLFEAKDIGKKFYLRIEDGIKLVPHVVKEPDVTMSGEVSVLVNVLMGKEDPDTVFFSRRLEITGDTASAIHLKNILAALG